MLLTAGLLAACNELHEEMPGGGSRYEKPVDVEMKLTVGGSDICQWKEKDEIGLFFVNTNGEVSETSNGNVKGFYDAGRWRLEKPVTASWENMKVYAYFPYDAAATAESCFLAANTREMYMYGNCDYYVNAVTREIHVDMFPALSFIRVRIRKVNYPDEKVMEAVSFTTRGTRAPEGLPLSGVLNLLTGEIRNTGYGEYVRKGLQVRLEEEFGDVVSFSCMPMTLHKETTAFGITISGTEYDVQLPQTLCLEQGMVHQISVTFDGKDVIVECVEVKEWAEEPMPPLDIL